MEFSKIMSQSYALLEAAEKALLKKLETTPNNKNLLFRIAETYRQKGEFQNGIKYLDRLIALEPLANNAKVLRSTLKQEVHTERYRGSESPAPFRLFENFLTEDEQKIVWEQVQKVKAAFGQSGVAENNLDKMSRKSSVLKKDELQEVQEWFLKKVKAKLRDSFEVLQVKSFIPSKIEIQLTASNGGDFFNLHKDQANEGRASSRQVTFVYYFHSEPRQFGGGDLLLFDTNTAKDTHASTHTRVFPNNNTVILFPSPYYHQVTPVANKNDVFEDGRFTLNGWIHRGSLT